MSRARNRPTLSTVLLALAGLAPGLAGQVPATSPPSVPPAVRLERLAWSADQDPAAPIRRFLVRNDYGDIRARPSDGGRLEAYGVAQRLGPPEAAVAFVVERREAALALTVTPPAGHVQDTDPHPPQERVDRLDLVVYLPPDVALDATTMRGLIEVGGLESEVAVLTLSGAIRVATSGAVLARSASGAITAALESAAGDRPSWLTSGSGAILATLAERSSWQVRLASRGGIRAPASLRRERERDLDVVSGRFGRGERFLLATSDSGAIELRLVDAGRAAGRADD
ncbi:MAG: hypothetical protein U0X73_00295 [Thermoanaerobaculia bacterium]